MGEGEKHKSQGDCNKNMDGVLQVMEEINWVVVRIFRRAAGVISMGKSSGGQVVQIFFWRIISSYACEPTL